MSEENQTGPTERVDIDGDTVPDAVTLFADESGDPGCEAFLEVQTAGAAIVAPVWPEGSTTGLPQPSIHSFVQLGEEPGYEILVNEAAGASTQFVRAYTLYEGAIVPIAVPDEQSGLFAFGGSVGHLEAADCLAGEVVVARAFPGAGQAALRKGLYDITRFEYTLEDGKLVKDAAEFHPKVPIDELDQQFPEFVTSPFGSCAAP